MYASKLLHPYGKIIKLILYCNFLFYKYLLKNIINAILLFYQPDSFSTPCVPVPYVQCLSDFCCRTARSCFPLLLEISHVLHTSSVSHKKSYD